MDTGGLRRAAARAAHLLRRVLVRLHPDGHAAERPAQRPLAAPAARAPLLRYPLAPRRARAARACHHGGLGLAALPVVPRLAHPAAPRHPHRRADYVLALGRRHLTRRARAPPAAVAHACARRETRVVVAPRRRAASGSDGGLPGGTQLAAHPRLDERRDGLRLGGGGLPSLGQAQQPALHAALQPAAARGGPRPLRGRPRHRPAVLRRAQ